MSKALVETVKANLIARGLYHPSTGNDASLQITCRVAWMKRFEGAKLISKRPEQNGAILPGTSQKVSHDAIAFSDPNSWKDCLANAGPPLNENRPTWDHTDSSSAPLVDPIDLDAATPPVPVPIPPVPQPPASQPYPDENGWWEKDHWPKIAARFAAAGRPFPPGYDFKVFYWFSRPAYSIGQGMTKEAAQEKHLKELDQVLGL